MTKLTADQVKAIPTLKEKGLTNHQIAEQYQVTYKTIQLWCRKLRRANLSVKKDKRGAKPLLINTN